MPDASPEEVRTEVQRNYEAFTKELPTLLTTHRGKFALMHDGAIIDFFDTARDAYVAGQRLYSNRLFSVQEVKAGAVDLGHYSVYQ
jgi:hypothetical protein